MLKLDVKGLDVVLIPLCTHEYLPLIIRRWVVLDLTLGDVYASGETLAPLRQLHDGCSGFVRTSKDLDLFAVWDGQLDSVEKGARIMLDNRWS